MDFSNDTQSLYWLLYVLMKIINRILDNPDNMDFGVSPFLHRSMQSKAGDIRHSIEGTLTKPQADKTTACFSHLDSIQQLKVDIEKAVIPLVAPFNPQIELLLSLPGIKDLFTPIAILGEIGVDKVPGVYCQDIPFF